MPFQRSHDQHELVIRRLVDPLQVLQRHRVADSGDDVLALGVLQVVAVDALRAGRRVAGERHPGAGVVAQVAEDHRDYVHRGPEVGRDALLPPVQHRPVSVPRVEHGLDRQVHLLPRVLREVAAGVLADDLLVGLRQVLEVLGAQAGVGGHATGLLRDVNRVLEVLAVDVEHGLAEHLDQPPVGVPGEPLVVGLPGKAVHRLIRQADVEDGLHHARHGELRPGPDADQQRVGGVAEPTAHRLLQVSQVAGDLLVQPGWRRVFLEVIAAGVRGNREAGRHG